MGGYWYSGTSFANIYHNYDEQQSMYQLICPTTTSNVKFYLLQDNLLHINYRMELNGFDRARHLHQSHQYLILARSWDGRIRLSYTMGPQPLIGMV